MGRFVEGQDRRQSWLLPSALDDYITADNPVRVIEAFIDELDLGALGFTRFEPAATGRPAYDPATLLKLYRYGYLNRVPSSRRLERQAQRNIEVMWLTGHRPPDHIVKGCARGLCIWALQHGSNRLAAQDSDIMRSAQSSATFQFLLKACRGAVRE